MMILRSSPASPFGRKVKIAAAILGLSDRIKTVEADTTNPSDDLRRQNPLGKIPALVLEDGTCLYDSRVIVDYLDSIGGNTLHPAGRARHAALVMQALADGIMDAALLQVYETRFRTEDQREAKWTDHQAGKVERGLAALEATPPSEAVDVGTIAVACALGYLDLRFDGRWRTDHPRLVAWLEGFESRVPAYTKTRFVPA